MSEPLPLDPLDPRSILRQLGHRPRKGLGQHFLVDRSYVASIIDAADVSGTDIVLEIGPGLGTLTMALADRGAHVIAVEIDPDVVRILSDRIGQRDNVRLLCGDILAWDPGALVESVCRAAGPRPWYKVVANLPYYGTCSRPRHAPS
jgi:16S rRNA (adenine1518-N6/adenine1519-N6)-dimethyltransferase